MYGAQKLKNIKYKKLNYKNVKFLVVAITCTTKVGTSHVKIIIIINFRRCISYIDDFTTVPCI